jgi:ABC-type nitrate/sulfonate/bicarbonate transport system substrate-binding protein
MMTRCKAGSVAATVAVCLLAAVCGLPQDAESVRVALDWYPNTNHTGIFAAIDLGFFAEEGLAVEVLQPGPTVSTQLVAAGRSEFGVSMQEYVTMFRGNQDAPVVSIAALLPHNTSGFAALRDAGISSPSDFADRRYGGWGQDLEMVMIHTVMELDGVSSADIEVVNIGMIDFVTAVRRNLADFFWIFYGWQGIHAELEGIDFVYLPLTELAEVLDYYTPVIIANEEMIAGRPDVVRRFVRAVARGYVYTALHPGEAAEILLRHAPELDADLVRASQAWLAEQAVADLAQWGRQEQSVWVRFADWALANRLIEAAIDPLAAFTNDFLPGDTE